MYEYSVPELRTFYEKIVSDEMREQADFIDGVVAGIGGAFGGYKQLQNSLALLRKGVTHDGE
jgi:hypothetical protein